MIYLVYCGIKSLNYGATLAVFILSEEGRYGLMSMMGDS